MSKRGPLIFLVILLALLLPCLIRIAWPFLTSLILASVVAIVTYPASEWVYRRVHRRKLATLLTTLATVGVLGLLIGFAGIAITQELTASYEALGRRSLEEGGWPTLVTHTTDRLVARMATWLPLDKDAIRNEIIDGIRTVTGYLLNNVGAALGGVASFLITGILTTVFLYFLLLNGKEWTDRLARLIPLESGITMNLFGAVHSSVMANVAGIVAVVLGQGLFLSFGFWFVGLRSPVLWGTIGGMASIIPVIGSPLVWVPVVAGYLLMGAYWKAILLGLWAGLVVGSVDNVIRSLVVGARDKQHPVIVALAAIGGTYAFGVLGILLGPLIVSLVEALLSEIRTVMTAAPEPESFVEVQDRS